ncbi:MAG: helix-turn-helix domain-containing protein [Bacteroidota bacterium]
MSSFYSIGRDIKSRRSDLRITQPQLAKIAEVSVNTIYKIERGQGNPRLSSLVKLLDVLGLELGVQVKKLNVD